MNPGSVVPEGSRCVTGIGGSNRLADARDTRDHALALGERRAAAVRNYLVSLGVPAARLSVTSWGKERPVTALPGYPASGISARVVLTVLR